MRIIFKILPYSILFLFLISAKLNAGEKNYNLLDLNKRIFQLQDTTQITSKKTTGFGGFGRLRLGLGHHDNLTKAKSYTGPKLKTSNTYYFVYIEVGAGFKMISAGFFYSFTFPISGTTTPGGYSHKEDIYDRGVLSHIRFLPLRNKVNLNAIFGYDWIDERASIYDPQGSSPDSLGLHYDDRGPFYGVESHYLFHKINKDLDLGLIFGYIYVNLRENNVNKYRAELGLFGHSFEKNSSGKEIFGYLASASLGLEFVDWSKGRKDWFVICSFKVTMKN